MVSSFVTDRAGRQLAITMQRPPASTEPPERILVPVANPANMERLIDLAVMLKSEPETPIYPLSVVVDDGEAQENVLMSQSSFEQVEKYAIAANQSISTISRVDTNASSGVVRAAKELSATTLVMGWNGKLTTQERFFGSVLDHVLEHAEPMVLVTKLMHPLNAFAGITVVMLPNAEVEPGFGRWVATVRTLAHHTTGGLRLLGNARTRQAVRQELEAGTTRVQTTEKDFATWDDFLVLVREVTPQDLLVVVSARENTVSHQAAADKVPYYLSQYFGEMSFLVVYPEQRVANRFGLV